MPDWKPEILRRIAPLKLSPPREQEIAEEIAQHLDDRYQDLLSDGLSPDSAFRAALDELKDEHLLARNLQPVESFTLPTGKQLLKVSALADWHTRDVWHYAEQHAIPLLPLYDLGYSSIGCEPCTSLPLSADDPRSGRWGGHKVECGIHIQPAPGASGQAEGH